MISTPDRQTAIALINEAITAGARRAKACAALEISDRTLRRWTKGGQVRPDQRPLVPRPNRPTSSARPNALPCWRPVIQRNFPAATKSDRA